MCWASVESHPIPETAHSAAEFSRATKPRLRALRNPDKMNPRARIALPEGSINQSDAA
jgi:hypothetical protein